MNDEWMNQLPTAWSRPLLRLLMMAAAGLVTLAAAPERGVAERSVAQAAPPPETSELLMLLKPWWDEAQSSDRTLQIQEINAKIKAAERNAAAADRYPSLRATADTGPSQSQAWNTQGHVTPRNETEWNSQAGINASLNLFRSGITSLRVTLAEQAMSISELDLQAARATLATNMARDLVTIWRQWRSLSESETLLAQARTLQQIALRKERSGFLGKKELLEAEREAFRSENERNSAAATLGNSVASFNSRYRLVSNPLQTSQLAGLQDALESLTQRTQRIQNTTASGNEAEEDTLAETLATRSLSLRRSERALAAAQLQHSIAQRQRYELTVDALAGVSHRWIDTTNSPGPEATRELAPSRALNVSAQLSVALPLFAPQASAEADVLLLQSDRTRTEVLRQREDIGLFLLNVRQQWPLLKESLSFNQKIVAMSDDLRSKNERLFEAGEIDAFVVIAGQKELSLQKQALAAAQARLYDLAVLESAAFDWGLIVNANPSGAAPSTGMTE